MPQRLLQTPPQAAHLLSVNGRELIACHEQITSILRSRLGQAHGDLLALPKRDGSTGAIDWATNLPGAATPAAQLPDEERLKLEQRSRRLLDDIRGLAAQLRAEGPAAQVVGQMLERAAELPPGDWLYGVGGKPVLAMWGHSLTAMADAPAAAATPLPRPPVAAAVPAAPADHGPAVAAAMASLGDGAAAPAGSATPPPNQPPPASPAALSATPPAPRRRGWLWLLLALIALALLLFGLTRCKPLGIEDLSAQLAEAEQRNQALEAEIAKRRASAPQFSCVAEPPPAASAPEPATSEPQPVASAPVPDPHQALQRKVEAAGKDCKALQGLLANEPLLKDKAAPSAAIKRDIEQRLQKDCKEKPVQSAQKNCPGQRPVATAPQMALVFDASSSMRQGLGSGRTRVRGGVTRIEAAREAAATVVRNVPSDIGIGLTLVRNCPAESAGFFSPSQRGQLIGTVQSIQPSGGTPLGDGVAKAGAMLDGVTRDAVMVVISDGKSTCGVNPCEAARQLARTKPRLKINVVDIEGTGAGNCLAQITGGQVFTARDADEVTAMTRRAAQAAMAPANCSAR